ncbi:unnamed protein product [Dicrocoelium dendriticum]|nr:unnamed protein product [Dicrocoelium dendriticum]
MVLIFEGRKYRCNYNTVNACVDSFCSMPSVVSSARAFRSHISRVTSGRDLLYVHQGEMATIPCVIGSDDACIPRLVASDDATSCVIVILRSQGLCLIAHLDNSHRAKAFLTRTTQVLSPDDAHLDAHLVGGFYDNKELAHSTIVEVMGEFLCNDAKEYSVKTFCVGELNTILGVCRHGPNTDRVIPMPAVTGVVFDWQSNSISPAIVCWEARGPVPVLRLSRLHSSNAARMLSNIFDANSHKLIIEPFRYSQWICNDPLKLSMDEMRLLSTTPDQEPATFFEGLRATVALMFHHPDPMRSWFSDGRLSFRCSDSIPYWRPLDEASEFALIHALT